MKVLVCGANGFIGSAIVNRLTAVGHQVIKGVRHPNGKDEIAMDYTQDLSIEQWLPRLQGIDAVINAVGILVETGVKPFSAIHDRAPCALFSACAKVGVKRVIQISALGAETGTTLYFASKRAADDYLAKQPIAWQIVYPSLVYGKEGDSARVFRILASLPIVVLPAGGKQIVQPIHIDDLTELVCRLLDPSIPTNQRIEAVGESALEYREMLQRYREALGGPPAIKIPIPRVIMELAAKLSGSIPGAIFNPDTWKMLQAGNSAESVKVSRLLGRPPRSINEFIPTPEAAELREQAFSAWRGIWLRASLAFVWIVTGLVSLFVFPKSESIAMLAQVGLEGSYAPTALYGAAILDLLLGSATLLYPKRALWVVQIAIILGYTAIITIAMPDYWAHPFGPITKNIPILAILVLLYVEGR